MPDDRPLLSKLNPDNVEPAYAVINPVFEEVPIRRMPYFSSLGFGYRLLGFTILPAGTRFDFHKNQHAVVVGDDIDLAMLKPVIPLQDMICLFFQIFDGKLFTDRAVLQCLTHNFILPFGRERISGGSGSDRIF